MKLGSSPHDQPGGEEGDRLNKRIRLSGDLINELEVSPRLNKLHDDRSKIATFDDLTTKDEENS
jgi:hypothetical protein